MTGATGAIAGGALLFVGTWLHPQQADPSDALAAFTEYAADRPWVATHLLRLSGVGLIVAAPLGFSDVAMALDMPAAAVLLVWMVVLGVSMWRAPVSREPAGPS